VSGGGARPPLPVVPQGDAHATWHLHVPCSHGTVSCQQVEHAALPLRWSPRSADDLRSWSAERELLCQSTTPLVSNATLFAGSLVNSFGISLATAVARAAALLRLGPPFSAAIGSAAATDILLCELGTSR